ncbi:hypothetical protein D3C78_1934030 [compost metagenome]
MLLQLAPIGVVLTMQPQLLDQEYQYRVLGCLGNLNMELLIPGRVSGAIFGTCQLLNTQ